MKLQQLQQQQKRNKIINNNIDNYECKRIQRLVYIKKKSKEKNVIDRFLIIFQFINKQKKNDIQNKNKATKTKVKRLF